VTSTPSASSSRTSMESANRYSTTDDLAAHFATDDRD
jgi:hypothetical protein